MTIWHLFCFSAFASPILAAVQQCRATKANILDYILSVLVCAFLGFLLAGVLWWGTRKSFATVRDSTAQRRIVVAVMAGLVSLGGVVLGGLCGERLATVILHL